MTDDSFHTGYYNYIPITHEENAPLDVVKCEPTERYEKEESKKPHLNETPESLEEVEKALKIVQEFAKRHWMPCLRDSCGDAMCEIEEMKRQSND